MLKKVLGEALAMIPGGRHALEFWRGQTPGSRAAIVATAELLAQCETFGPPALAPELEAAARRAAERAGIVPELVLALAWEMSGGDPSYVGGARSGAFGLPAQLRSSSGSLEDEAAVVAFYLAAHSARVGLGGALVQYCRGDRVTAGRIVGTAFIFGARAVGLNADRATIVEAIETLDELAGVKQRPKLSAV